MEVEIAMKREWACDRSTATPQCSVQKFQFQFHLNRSQQCLTESKIVTSKVGARRM